MKAKYQPASLDMWDKKYRLKTKDGQPIDKTIQDTFKRVAKKLASVEKTPELQEYWYKKFLWAMENGAIPAGRILSNAGAEEYKPHTSTINCTVSGTIHDSMDGILTKLHEAGMTLKAGCGIGYEFSTLRPKGSFVSGAGAYTSGPLSFMDIFDTMCFTVSSAGGRRGAQMATFDISHPDVMDFIRAKREDGRLRQFNLSLLITKDFVEAVKKDKDWDLVFPIRKNETIAGVDKVVWKEYHGDKEDYITDDNGLVAHRVYNTVKARRLWDMIMSSTYDYAEPGFILIDKANKMNNNWWCEEFRATNPCVTGDTRLATQYGLIPIRELYENNVRLQCTVDKRALGQDERGTEVRPAVPAFMTAKEADVYRVVTLDGYEIRATEWHEFYTQRGKIQLRDMRPGDEILVQSGKGQFGSYGSENLGILLGLLAGDGYFTNDGKGHQIAAIDLWEEKRLLAPLMVKFINELIYDSSHNGRRYTVQAQVSKTKNMVYIKSVILARILDELGINKDTKLRVPEIVWRGTEECVRGYIQGLFQTDGTVNISGRGKSCSIRLSSSEPRLLQDVQVLLANFGIFSRIRHRRAAGKRLLPDGKGGKKLYMCRDNYELIIDGESRERFMKEIGFLLKSKNAKYYKWVKDKALRLRQRFTTKVVEIKHDGREPVYDTTQPDNNTVIFQGLVTGQCSEQFLPPYGACLLGSVNLTQFVENPFTDEATFDWDKYKEVVSIFTRMLDNVVEINGLPLEQQREEIFRKRRHGMGYLGLGSTMTMLKIKYGSKESLEFTDKVSKEMAITGWRQALELAKEKGPAPIMDEEFTVTSEMLKKRPELELDGYKVGDKIPGRVLHAKYSKYMRLIAEEDNELVEELAKVGARFTHHTSIAPTGTISLSIGNNVSNGIEPSFGHHYKRNIIKEGKKTKENVDVYSYELLMYRELINPKAMPYTDNEDEKLPDYFITAEDVTPKQHVDVQAAAQKWVDSSISKTINVPTDFPYEDFKDIYLYAYEKGLKGCTTFRFNPEVFQGVLVREKDLENTIYEFELEDGEIVKVKGNEEIEYDGETHTAANLYDALKEGYYGKF